MFITGQLLLETSTPTAGHEIETGMASKLQWARKTDGVSDRHGFKTTMGKEDRWCIRPAWLQNYNGQGRQMVYQTGMASKLQWARKTDGVSDRHGFKTTMGKEDRWCIRPAWLQNYNGQGRQMVYQTGMASKL